MGDEKSKLKWSLVLVEKVSSVIKSKLSGEFFEDSGFLLFKRQIIKCQSELKLKKKQTLTNK